ncbi:CbiK protein [Streptococcus varani]|uniref:CbiK protein n=1 Tax=Streptococcus varani TaxID=1608583 RepID=A0A0E3WFJ4_9STRE|nr:sirohydrochlorin cobaltochelatase [Streptococcus varani]CQR25627.1 CbiK protein [Streptococcus varani]
MTKAILVVSFGTTYPKTREKTIEACEKAIQAEYPELPVYRAFTSNVVIRRIRENEGLEVPTVFEVLDQMKSEGIRQVYIQPLHIIQGSEYDKILTQLETYRSYFESIKIGKPLLHRMEDYESVIETLIKYYGSYGENTATVLMGHGTQHQSFIAYAALDHMLQESRVFLGCVESYPPVEKIERRLNHRGIKEIHLAPFMLVAGDHATNDLISEEEDSWSTFFRNKGYKVHYHLIGLGEFKEIRELYIQHLREIMD